MLDLFSLPLLLAQGTEVSQPVTAMDPSGIVAAAASGNAVTFLAALLLVVIGLLTALFVAYVKLMTRRENDLLAKDAIILSLTDGKATAEREKATIERDLTRTFTAEKAALMERHFQETMKMRRLAERMLKMESEDGS